MTHPFEQIPRVDMSNFRQEGEPAKGPRVYFISGRLDLTEDEFVEHYVPWITAALGVPGAGFVVGDARGADSMAQAMLQLHPHRVRVYHMFETPRNNLGPFTCVGGFTSDAERDTAMTACSDEDIAWVRPGREKSGTAQNLRRRERRTGGQSGA